MIEDTLENFILKIILNDGSVLTRDGYCTREIRMRIAIAKEAFNRKYPSWQESKTLNSGWNWLGVMFAALHFTAQRLEN